MINLKTQKIGKTEKPFIIAEMSGNHNQSLDRALEIVQEMGYTWNKIAGPQFWMYKGKTLYELNNQ